MQRDIWWESPKRRLDFEDRNMLTKITVFVDSDFAGGPRSRGRARRDWWLRLVTTLWNSGSTPQSLTALSVGEAEFYAVMKGGQVGLSLRSMYQDLGIPVKIEIQSDSSTANSLTDRLGAGQRTKHIDTWFFWIQETSSRWRPQYQEGAHSKERRRCCQSLLQYYNNIASLQDRYSTDRGSHTPLPDDGGRADDGSCDGAADPQTRAQKQTVVSVDREHRDGCAS